ncbi:MAG: hypothetical protein HQM12_05045 [SAR324 cluster bacterium]|nr:hypothetical protein [SAR324 cluster bacterium]
MDVLSYENLLKHLDSPYIRIQMWAAYHLTEHWGKDCEKFARKFIESDTDEIKESGIYLIGQYQIQELGFPLFRIFNQSSGTLKIASATALAELHYENAEPALMKWTEDLLQANEFNIPELQSAAQSMLLFDNIKYWTALAQILKDHYESHVKSLALFGVLSEALTTPAQIEELIRHYTHYRKNFADPLFLQHLTEIFEGDEVIDYISVRMGYGYSLRMMYQECANVLGVHLETSCLDLLDQLDATRQNRAIEQIPALMQSLFSQLPQTENESLESACVRAFGAIVIPCWEDTILKIQDRELNFIMSLPLLHLIKQVEQQCMASPEQHTATISRLYHSAILRNGFMVQVIELFSDLSFDHVTSPPLSGSFSHDTARDALWKLITRQLDQVEYPFPQVLPKPWKHNLTFLLPKLSEIYKTRLENYILTGQHDQVDYALELFARLPDEESLQIMLKHFTVLINQHFHLFFELMEYYPDQSFLPKLLQHYREDESELAQLIELLCLIHNIPNPLNDHHPLISTTEGGTLPHVRILCPECHASYRYPISVLYYDQEMIEQRRVFDNIHIWTPDQLNCKNCQASLPFRVDKEFLSNLYAETLTAQLLRISEAEAKAMEPFKPLRFPLYFGKKTNPGVFFKKMEADIKADRLSKEETTQLLLETGRLYLALDRLNEAQETFTRCLELSSNHPVALFHLGVIAFRKKNLHDARMHFSRLVSISTATDFDEHEENLYTLASHYLEILNRREFKRASFQLIRS